MKFLLDTHCWLWLQTSPRRLVDPVLAQLEDQTNEIFLSAASSWEISIKHSVGKLRLPEPPTTYVPSRMRTSGTKGLAVEHVHALRLAELPLHHRDPFDRMLVAQAQIEAMILVTVDPQLEAYDVQLLFGDRIP